ncbi:class I SAM-dependent methyltransferase [Mycolicibacterium mucogenicum]|uniref:Class I SAM-dependent methyltransferase n=1 Tax=Mycolicibacterium mucogenicum DSM 44124 TaxID=1226753 RepID=A0A8H2JFJ0_MYCMU|nr:class I SAM-dependent methyltransferase [Mycolicibacterium mucogenicum]KAB7755542.1 methyltransferase type 11 [Mycolicibacterium mucogenicum DSM 44124]QPG68281.1 class I SAM-dependent methyltransferase [Mycolicibacterium mucogenicum DSM 44124]
MRSFADLVHEAETADVTGWGFGWLAGRAVEERPPWSYVQLLARRFENARAALDLDTGGGEVIDEMPVLPPRLVVTESWPPNARAARERLSPRGVQVVETAATGRLPFDDGSFDLVTSRHPVAPNWSEIARVLHPGGHYFAQHVGPASAFELIEYFLGPLPVERRQRDPHHEADAAVHAGLAVTDLREARCRMEFYDVGAVVWILRKCPWWVPGFSVERYREQLVELDRRMRDGTPFVAHSTRHLIEARR